jgi:hypothetical protein
MYPPEISCPIAAFVRFIFRRRISVSGPSILHLGVYPAGSDGHDNGLRCSDLFLGNPFLLGDPKIMLHSGITAKGHGRSKMD